MTYDITPGAERDIKEITNYTIEKWGIEAVDKYIGELENKLDAIGRGKEIKRLFNGIVPELYVSRFRYHLIFYLVVEGKKPSIIRILHDKQDKIRHLKRTFSNFN